MGVISTQKSKFVVKEVKLQDRAIVLHFGEFVDGTPFGVGEVVDLRVDGDRRILHAKIHSAGISCIFSFELFSLLTIILHLGHLLDSALENIGVKLIPGKGYFLISRTLCYPHYSKLSLSRWSLC